MRKNFSLCVLVGGIAMVTAGVAQAEPCDRPQDTAGAVVAPVEIIDGKNVLGRSAFSCGHFWSAANLIEKSLSEDQTVLERFNLAAAYARTGRYAQADALYQTVVDDGDYIDVRMDTAANSLDVPVRGFNLAEEAARRRVALGRLQEILVPSDTPSNLSAFDAAVNVADVSTPNTTIAQTTPVIPQAVSDIQALERDGLSPPSN